MLDKLQAGKDLPAFEDAYFSPIYVGSLATCLLELASTDITGVMHVAGRERSSKLEFAKTLAEVFDLPEQHIVATSVDKIDFDAPRGRDLSLSVQRAAHRLDCELPTVRKGLELMRRDERA
jgi:dTDP-4-dehydrorhamnose reductase